MLYLGARMTGPRLSSMPLTADAAPLSQLGATGCSNTPGEVCLVVLCPRETTYAPPSVTARARRAGIPLCMVRCKSCSRASAEGTMCYWCRADLLSAYRASRRVKRSRDERVTHVYQLTLKGWVLPDACEELTAAAKRMCDGSVVVSTRSSS